MSIRQSKILFSLTFLVIISASEYSQAATVTFYTEESQWLAAVTNVEPTFDITRSSLTLANE